MSTGKFMIEKLVPTSILVMLREELETLKEKYGVEHETVVIRCDTTTKQGYVNRCLFLHDDHYSKIYLVSTTIPTHEEYNRYPEFFKGKYEALRLAVQSGAGVNLMFKKVLESRNQDLNVNQTKGPSMAEISIKSDIMEYEKDVDIIQQILKTTQGEIHLTISEEIDGETLYTHFLFNKGVLTEKYGDKYESTNDIVKLYALEEFVNSGAKEYEFDVVFNPEYLNKLEYHLWHNPDISIRDANPITHPSGMFSDVQDVEVVAVNWKAEDALSVTVVIPQHLANKMEGKTYALHPTLIKLGGVEKIGNCYLLPQL